VPEIIDTVFAKTSRKRSFSMTEYERFGLVFTKRWSINSGTGIEIKRVILCFCFLLFFCIFIYEAFKINEIVEWYAI